MEESWPADVLAKDRLRVFGAGIAARIAADRDALIAARHDRSGGKEPRFLGFTRADWIHAGAPTHYLGYNHQCPHPDLLILCRMVAVVDRWRREAASRYEGEHGPVPEFWNMPDLVAEWECANPAIAAARDAHAAREHRQDERDGAPRHRPARQNGNSVSRRVSFGQS